MLTLGWFSLFLGSLGFSAVIKQLKRTELSWDAGFFMMPLSKQQILCVKANKKRNPPSQRGGKKSFLWKRSCRKFPWFFLVAVSDHCLKTFQLAKVEASLEQDWLFFCELNFSCVFGAEKEVMQVSPSLRVCSLDALTSLGAVCRHGDQSSASCWDLLVKGWQETGCVWICTLLLSSGAEKPAVLFLG